MLLGYILLAYAGELLWFYIPAINKILRKNKWIRKMRKLGTLLLICSALAISACAAPNGLVEPAVASETKMNKL